MQNQIEQQIADERDQKFQPDSNDGNVDDEDYEVADGEEVQEQQLHDEGDDGDQQEEEEDGNNGGNTPQQEELEEEEQDMVQTEEETKFAAIDNIICADLFNRLNAFQMHA